MMLRSESPEGECSYYEHGRACHEPAVGELQAHFQECAPWPMCERHIQPEMHPSDLRDKLVRS